jgi:phytanoyl-CoA hydroxylase
MLNNSVEDVNTSNILCKTDDNLLIQQNYSKISQKYLDNHIVLCGQENVEAHNPIGVTRFYFHTKMSAENFDIKKFQQDGYLVIENFLTDEEIESLQRDCRQIVEQFDPTQNRSIFSAEHSQHFTDLNFISSADKVRCFLEEEALDSEGNLAVDKSVAINKIGHALHLLRPAFKSVSHSDKVKNLLKSLGFVDPVIPQSMFIFKVPSIGAKVTPHQDGSYLYVDPIDGHLVGLWFPLVDATAENGCLSFIPGSHKNGVLGNYRNVRTTDAEHGLSLKYDGEKQDYDMKDFVLCPVKKGSLVLIDGLVVHKSERNCSTSPRPIYTFHVYDAANSTYSDANWLQPTDANTFSHMFDA